jgi:uncharacterized protein YceK
MRVLTVLTLGLALTGCGTLYDAPPEKPMKLASDDVSSQKWCHDALLLMDNPFFDPDSKDAVAKEMKIHECRIPM